MSTAARKAWEKRAIRLQPKLKAIRAALLGRKQGISLRHSSAEPVIGHCARSDLRCREQPLCELDVESGARARDLDRIVETFGQGKQIFVKRVVEVDRVELGPRENVESTVDELRASGLHSRRMLASDIDQMQSVLDASK